MIATQKGNGTIDDVRIAAFFGIRTKEVRNMLFQAARTTKVQGKLRITLEHGGKKFHIDCANAESLDVILGYFDDFNNRYIAGREAQNEQHISDLLRVYPNHRVASDLAIKLGSREFEPYYK